MDRTERFYKIDQLLRENRVVTLGQFLDFLQVSRATFKRDLEYLRERLNAPIEWDRDLGGYAMKQQQDGPRYALPGAWFSSQEIQALLAVQQVLGGLQAGWLKEQLAPLQARLWAMVGEKGFTPGVVESRIRLLSPAVRPVEPECFSQVTQAVLGRRRLAIDYFHRARNEVTPREISPQRLIHYRGNWYVDAWCHLRQDIRSFSLDAIRHAQVLELKSDDIAADELDRVLAAGYGIFSGVELQWAHLRFSPERARWVQTEVWHPDQRVEWDESGCFNLHLPYADSRELVMDILRHGAALEVISPSELRQRVQEEARAIAKKNQ